MNLSGVRVSPWVRWGYSLGQCQILALRPALTHPQFLASSRHVSMDAISVHNETWEHDTLTLSLTGVPGTTETYWFFLPEEYHLTGTTGKDITPVVTQHGQVIAVATTFHKHTGTLRLHCQR